MKQINVTILTTTGLVLHYHGLTSVMMLIVNTMIHEGTLQAWSSTEEVQ